MLNGSSSPPSPPFPDHLLSPLLKELLPPVCLSNPQISQWRQHVSGQNQIPGCNIPLAIFRDRWLSHLVHYLPEAPSITAVAVQEPINAPLSSSAPSLSTELLPSIYSLLNHVLPRPSSLARRLCGRWLKLRLAASQLQWAKVFDLAIVQHL